MTVTVSYQGPNDPLPDLMAKLEQAKMEAAIELLAETTNEAKKRAGLITRTGALLRSITATGPTRHGDEITGTVTAGGAGAPYAAAQDLGSGLWGPSHAKYPIVPKTPGGVLAWPHASYGPPGGRFRRLSGAFKKPIQDQINAGTRIGAYVFAKKVMHPGVRPTRFLTGAAEDVFARAGDVCVAAIRRVLGG